MNKRILLILFIVSNITLSYSQWTQLGQDLDGEGAGEQSGRAISISADGNVVAIGAPNNNNGSGHVRVYENVSGVWVIVGQDIDGELGDGLGKAVSISADGNTVAVGAPFDDANGNDSGYVRVYENIGGVWTQVGVDIYGEGSGDRFGSSVSLSPDGSTVAIGAYYNDSLNGSDPGHVRVYENITGVWSQIGLSIEGIMTGSDSGFPKVSLSADGSILAIGAEMYSGSGSDPGNVRVYKNVSGSWIQVGTDILGEDGGDWFGTSVSLSANGNIVAIGSMYHGGDVGHVRIYENVSDTWVQIGTDIDGEAAGDLSGWSVSLSADGSKVAIGALYNNGNGNNSGHVRIYENVSDTWMQIGADIEGEAANDLSGWSVSLNADGSKVAIGAINNDGNGNNSGHTRVFENSNVLSVETFTGQNFMVYPNPVTTDLTIISNTAFDLITMYDVSGRNLKSIQLKSSRLEYQLDVKDLSRGMYVVELQLGKVKQQKKIIKK